MSVYILMVLSLAGPQGQPVATMAFSDMQLCVKQSGAFNALSLPHAYSWCMEKKPNGTTSPVVLTPSGAQNDPLGIR
jgi:hypothetical protein